MSGVTEKKRYRVLLSSDIHCTDFVLWYGWQNEDRLERWLSFVNREHERDPFDLILLLGDYSLDFWMDGGSWLDKGHSDAAKFMNRYASRLPKDVPLVVIPGNHEQYSDSEWVEITGNHRQESIVLGDCVFVLLDNFKTLEEVGHRNDGIYKPLDADYFRHAAAENPDKNIFLLAHYFNTEADGDVIRCLEAECGRIIGLFQGHTHRNTVIHENGVAIAETGNYSYTSMEDKVSTFWGVRDLVIENGHAVSRYIIDENRASLDGTDTQIPRQICETMEYDLRIK